MGTFGDQLISYYANYFLLTKSIDLYCFQHKFTIYEQKQVLILHTERSFGFFHGVNAKQMLNQPTELLHISRENLRIGQTRWKNWDRDLGNTHASCIACDNRRASGSPNTKVTCNHRERETQSDLTTRAAAAAIEVTLMNVQ